MTKRASSLENLLKKGLARLVLILSAGMTFILMAQAIIYSYQTQNAICSILNTKVDQYGGSLGREIALGDTAVAGGIFLEFKKALKAVNANENLSIDFNTAGSDAPACAKSLISAQVTQPIYFGARQVATIRGQVGYFPGVELFLVVVALSFLLAVAVRFWRDHATLIFEKQVIEPIRKLSRGETISPSQKLPSDVQMVAANIEGLKAKILAEQKRNFELEKSRELADVAAQVAHDVKSPLLLLSSITKGANGLTPDKQELLLQAASRIEKITGDLLIRYKQEKLERNGGEAHLLLAALEKTRIEKMAIHEAKNPRISINVGTEPAGAFVSMDLSDLNRVLSNLVENAIEAVEGETPEIQMNVKGGGSSEKVIVEIQDNGRGIPPEILSRLGKKGVTFGKKNGNGLGLYDSKKKIEAAGGNFAISSGLKKGTTVTLGIPVVSAPAWMATGFRIPWDKKIVVVDDDLSFHEFWKQKLSGTTVKFFEGEDPELKKLAEDESNFFIFDNHLTKEDHGIELIERLKVAARTVLVTYDFEVEGLQKRCQDAGCKMLPKPILPYLSFDSRDAGEDSGNYDLVLIDNDDLMRMAWQIRAQDLYKNLGAFENVEQFLGASVNFETPVYIDFHLDNGVTGTDVARQLFESGFKNLFITTGDHRINFVPPYVKSIQGKDFPAA